MALDLAQDGGKAEVLGEAETEAIEKGGLRTLRLDDAAKSKIESWLSRC